MSWNEHGTVKTIPSRPMSFDTGDSAGRVATGGSRLKADGWARFTAFFEFIREVPEFLRILNEAEFFAPTGYQKHFDNISTAYVRILKRARLAGTISDFSDDELEAIVQMLMGARGYLSRRYSYSGGTVSAVPDHVILAYQKLVTRGLFKAADDGNGHER